MMTYLRHMYVCVSVCLCVCLCVSVCVSVCVYMYIRWDRALGRSPSWRVDQRVRKDPDGESPSLPLSTPHSSPSARCSAWASHAAAPDPGLTAVSRALQAVVREGWPGDWMIGRSTFVSTRAHLPFTPSLHLKERHKALSTALSFSDEEHTEKGTTQAVT